MSVRSKITKTKWCITNRQTVQDYINKQYKKEKNTMRNANIIRNSAFFDEKWYLKNNIDLQDSNNQNIDLARHYLEKGARQGKDPSRYFCSEEYYALHEDVKKARINPLLHYETRGKNEGRIISSNEEVGTVIFPNTACETDRVYPFAEVEKKRAAVVSCFFADGKIPDTLIYLLRGLREVADQLILIGDCLVIPEELNKLNGIVCYAKFERHEQYDFGSYKRGLSYLRSNNMFETLNIEELIFINDSCYGPVFPFSESFQIMSERANDFWGYSRYKSNYKDHISSYFMVFKMSVITSGKLDDFLERVDGRYDRGEVIAKFETEITDYLHGHGFFWETFAPDHCNNLSLFYHPVSFLTNRVPLVKKKALTRKSDENLSEVLELIKDNAPDLAQLIPFKPFEEKEHKLITIEDHVKSFDNICKLVSEKTKQGEKIKAVFLVPKSSMFPSKPLFDAMMRSELYEPFVAVIPDIRWGRDPLGDIVKCEKELLNNGIPKEQLMRVREDELGRWPDVLKGMDMVCFNTPYNLSYYKYCPHYTIGKRILPIMVNYGFYRSKYDNKLLALDNYAYMWKAFFECKDTLEQYHNCSEYGGINGDLVGYMKMDPLEAYMESTEKNNRKRILIALHHSVEGGSNDYLALANIFRYERYFLALPERYPEIDFIFRPHPFLFRILSRKNLWGKEKVESFISEMRSKKNVIWSEGGDYLKEFAESDGCIQDCGSFLVEYLYTSKPCCYMLKTASDIDTKFTSLGKKCLDQCYISYNSNEIDQFIEEVIIKENDKMAETRNSLAQEIMVNYPHAAEMALDSITHGLLINNQEMNKEQLSRNNVFI